LCDTTIYSSSTPILIKFSFITIKSIEINSQVKQENTFEASHILSKSPPHTRSDNNTQMDNSAAQNSASATIINNVML
jgi:hypothetical protein